MPSHPLIVSAIAQFLGGTEAQWNASDTPLPAGTVAVASDTGIVKLGDGAGLFEELPTRFNLTDMAALWQFWNANRDVRNTLMEGDSALAVYDSGSGVIRFTLDNAIFDVEKTSTAFSFRPTPSTGSANGRGFSFVASDSGPDGGQGGGLLFQAGNGAASDGNIVFQPGLRGNAFIGSARILTEADVVSGISTLRNADSAVEVKETGGVGTVTVTVDTKTLLSIGSAYTTAQTAAQSAIAATPTSNNAAALYNPRGDLVFRAARSDTAITGVAGTIFLLGGDAATGAGALDGGGLVLQGGAGRNGGTSGGLGLYGGAGVGTGPGGAVTVGGGSGGASGGAGAKATVRGGSALAANTAGAGVDIVAGTSTGTAAGADINIVTGTSGTGGSGALRISTNGGGAFLDGVALLTTAGTAAAATKLATARTLSLSGAVSGTSGGFDGTGNFALTTTLGANVVTDAVLRQGAATSVVGRGAGTTGNVADIAATADGQVLRRTGGVLGFSKVLFSELQSTPTSLSGYGILDAAPLSHVGTGGTAHALATGATDGFMPASHFYMLNTATNIATGGALVLRDASGNFSAGTITATLSGNASTATLAASATKLATARNISITGGATAAAVAFDGTAVATLNVTSLDATKLTGLVPLSSIPASALERLVVVADQTARFALTTATVQQGDVVKETATLKMYYLKDEANLANATGWEEFSVGTAAAVAWTGITGRPASIDGLALLDTTTGAVVQTGASSYGKLAIGVGTASSLVDRAGADTRYALLSGGVFTGATSAPSAYLTSTYPNLRFNNTDGTAGAKWGRLDWESDRFAFQLLADDGGTWTRDLLLLAADGTVTVPNGLVVGTGTTGGNKGSGSINVSSIYINGVALGSGGAAGGSVTSIATGTGLSGGPITSTGTISLANTTVAAGSYGSATQAGTFTVDAQGRLTAAGSVTIQPTWTNVQAKPTTLAGYGFTDLTSLGNAQVLVINSTAGAAEGGQIALAYRGISGLTGGDANSSWNIDVEGANNFRIYRRGSDGVYIVPLTVYEASGDINVSRNLSVNGALTLANTVQDVNLYMDAQGIANTNFRSLQIIKAISAGNENRLFLRFTRPSDSTVRDVIFDAGTQTMSLFGQTVYTSGNFTPSNYMPLTGGITTGALVATTDGVEWPLRSIYYAGTASGRGHLLSQKARGTKAAPTAIQSGDLVGGLSVGGHNSSALTYGWNGGGEITLVARENWTTTANGSRWTFSASAIGATTPTTVATLDTTSASFTVPTTVSSGQLTVAQAGAADTSIWVTAPAGQTRSVNFTTAGTIRWNLGAHPAAETGSNVGSNFFINRYSDAGTFIDTPFWIGRDDGGTHINAALSVGGTIVGGASLGVVSAFVRNTGSTSGDSTVVAVGSNSDPLDAQLLTMSSTNTSYAGARSFNILVNAGNFGIYVNRAAPVAALTINNATRVTDFAVPPTVAGSVIYKASDFTLDVNGTANTAVKRGTDGAVVGAYLYTSSAAPAVVWSNSSGAANTKLWRANVGATTLSFNVASDDWVTSTNWLVVTRSGTAVTSVDFKLTPTVNSTPVLLSTDATTSVTGSSVARRNTDGTLWGTGLVAYSTVPTIWLDDTDNTVSSNERKWFIQSNAGKLYFSAVSDDGTQSANWLEVTRAGFSPDKVTFKVPVWTNYASLPGTNGVSSWLHQANSVTVDTNTDQLLTRINRYSATAGWLGTAWELRRKVDATEQSFLRFGYDGNGYGLTLGTGSANVLYVNSGVVGVNTTTPGAEFEIADGNANSDTRVNIRATGSVYGQIGRTATQMFLDTVNGDPFLIYGNSYPQFRVDAVANAANVIRVYGATTGNAPVLSTTGGNLLITQAGGLTGQITQTGAIVNDSSVNWNYANLTMIRRASNGTSSKVMAILLDGDSTTETSLTNGWHLMLNTTTNPTAGATSAATVAGLTWVGKGNFGVQPSTGILELVHPTSTAYAQLKLGASGAFNAMVRETDGRFRMVNGSASLDMTGSTATLVAAAARLSLITLTAVSNVFTMDCNTGNEFDAGTLAANATFANPTNLPAAGTVHNFTIKCKQDTTGGRTVALGTNWTAVGNATPNTGAGKTNLYVGKVYPDGSVVYSVVAGI